MIGYILGWILTGLIVGALARLLLPGRQDIGIGLTIVLGIVGAMLGGFISWLLFGPTVDARGGYDVAVAWPGWIMSILGAFLVLWGFMAANRRGPTV